MCSVGKDGVFLHLKKLRTQSLHPSNLMKTIETELVYKSDYFKLCTIMDMY